jgi:hypothetical protein
MPGVSSFLKKFESAPTRLLRLSAEGKTEKVREMVDKPGVEYARLLGARDSQGRTPFFLAVVNGHQEIARMLFILGSDPLDTNAAGQTPLQALLAIPEPTEDHLRLVVFLRGIARWQTLHPEDIANPEVRKKLERQYFPITKVSPTAVNVVARAKNLPEDIEGLIKGYGRRKTARKTKRRQTRRRR